jgi:hypothetical protein
MYIYSVYSTLGSAVKILGAEHSIIRPELYSRVLLPLEAVSFLLQLVGFGVMFSGSTLDGGLGSTATKGAYVVLTGLVIQFVTLIEALTMLLIVLFRSLKALHKYGYTTFHKDVGYISLTTRFVLFASMAPTALVCILSRLAYRIAEFSGPLNSGLAANESAFIGLEGFFVAYALVALVVFHPGVFMDDGKSRAHAYVEDRLPFFNHQNNLEEVRRVYIEQERRISGNSAWAM